jgi:hypothetical protein
MSVKKVSVSLPAEVLAAAMDVAQAEGVALSAWLAEAARRRVRDEVALDVGYQAAQQLVVEYEAQHGRIPAEAHAWAEAVWADAQRGGEVDESPGWAAS